MNLAAAFLGLDYPTWVGIAIGSLVTVLVAALVYRLQKTPKTLDYASSEPDDLRSDEEVFPGLAVDITWAPTHDGERLGPAEVLRNAQVVHYRIQNTGRRAIRADDFQEPISVTAPEGELVDCAVTTVSHPGVCPLGSVYVSCDEPRPDNNVIFTPALMNPGDWVDISVLTDGLKGHVKIDAWIVGQTRAMRRRQRLILPTIREIAEGTITMAGATFAVVSILVVVAVVLGVVSTFDYFLGP